MSGLEGMAALGLACNLFKVIGFGRETLDQVKRIYRDGNLDNSIVDKITAIQSVASNIIDIDISQAGNQEKKLVDVTKKCIGVARDLQEEIAFLVGHNGQASLRATLKIAVKANWRRRRLERMEKDLADSEQLMQTNLLAWVFKSLNSANINMDSLEQEVRTFVIKYEQGCRRASELVSREASQVREVIVRESRKTEKALRAHVVENIANLDQRFKNRIEHGCREQARERLLKSLKYPGMNERINQVENAHARTFRWLFADADDLGYSDDEESCGGGCWGLDDQHAHGEHARYANRSTDNKDKEKPPEMVWSSFTDWLQSDAATYWITGKPGSGKSTLSKFIVSETRTRIALEKWRPGVVMASHYFWRPGSLLQRSIKGMLCSLSYQLALSVPGALEYASAGVAGLAQKDTDTDWSVMELQQLYLSLIRHCGKPLCLLIDGLDECGQEDSHEKLLEVLGKMRLANVKIIVTSRNEPVFEKGFRHEPQLRVQDLTAGDLRTYATDLLSHEIKDHFSKELVEKSEGVFLWLVLAVKSINRGFGNGEDLSDLRRRVRNLPRGLNDLYKDMWQRMNEDGDLYRENAALYFKLAIAAHDEQLKCLKYGWSALEMTLASLPKTHHAFAKRPVISASQLLKECERFHKRVEVRCAGLLCLDNSSMSIFLKEGLGDTQRALIEYADGKLFRFVHRSAHDFLVDTVEGQEILRHDGASPEDVSIRIMGARFRAVELLGLTVRELSDSREWRLYNPLQKLDHYLADVSSIAGARGSAARELTSLCYELYSSSRFPVLEEDACPTRTAVFFAVAASYPNLNPYATSIVQTQLTGSGVRSAVLLAVASARCSWDCVWTDPAQSQRTFPLSLVRWLLRLPGVDVNLQCPLLGAANRRKDNNSPEGIGPLDHIKASPFARLLGSGLVRLDWRQAEGTRHRYNITQFLGLVSDFAHEGADFHTTLFLAFRLDYLIGASPGRQEALPGFFQISELKGLEWTYSHHNDGSLLGVVALQATTVIGRMLASLAKTGPGQKSINEDRYCSDEEEYRHSDLEKATSLLSLRCHEYSCEAHDRVIGFLQPCENLVDMPYRQVSEQDSAHLITLMWACIFEDDVRKKDLEIGCREVVARSPFSSIGFRDYMRDMGCFDELAAHKVRLEYQQDMSMPSGR